MGEDKINKLYLDEFHNIKGMDNESLMLENKEIKAIIHDFYKKEQEYINQFTDDEKYRELIFKLYQHLGYKSQFDNFSMVEKNLLYLIHTYTDSLVNEFKSVLKEVET
ncbi:hypothetical protein [Virgibacillus halodenitrificans]|uniref:hypothetical protein n=1 Tax=Virgibacillus halodenitrificans TaxID=1482 RepID=UPI00045CE011|nr:hypothetical protein [Virgibacillus halodenitrificans]CDQ37686.1 hypothetical protein BN993_07248 [Virgibacillus halodenitrificans]